MTHFYYNGSINIGIIFIIIIIIIIISIIIIIIINTVSSNSRQPGSGLTFTKINEWIFHYVPNCLFFFKLNHRNCLQASYVLLYCAELSSIATSNNA